MEDVKIRVIDSDKLIKAINDGSYEVNLSAVMALGAVVTQSASQWTPCSERLPEEPFGCIVTVWDTNPLTMDDFENVLPYFVGWDGEQWNGGDGEQCPFEVIAWMPLPTPYREGGTGWLK